MKKIITLFFLMLTFNVFSYEKYVCQEYDVSTKKILQRTIVLEPVGEPSDHYDEDGNFNSQKIPYTFVIYKGLDTFNARPIKGFVFTEGVFFSFLSSESELSFEIYLDEMDEGDLYVSSDSKTAYFVCR